MQIEQTAVKYCVDSLGSRLRTPLFVILSLLFAASCDKNSSQKANSSSEKQNRSATMESAEVDTPVYKLVKAAELGDEGAEEMERLLAKGVDINSVYQPEGAPESYGQTALINALRKGDRFLIDLLLERKAAPSLCVKNRLDGSFPYCPVDAAIDGGNADYVELFITSYGVHNGMIRTLTRRLDRVESPAALLKTMIHAKFDVNAGGEGGDPSDYPLCYARNAGNDEIVSLLTEAGARCELN